MTWRRINLRRQEDPDSAVSEGRLECREALISGFPVDEVEPLGFAESRSPYSWDRRRFRQVSDESGLGVSFSRDPWVSFFSEEEPPVVLRLEASSVAPGWALEPALVDWP